jgi:hypothetical protein
MEEGKFVIDKSITQAFEGVLVAFSLKLGN